MSDIVRVELGGSVLQGELAVQIAREQGLKVELIRNVHPETGWSQALGSCALLVNAADEAELRQILTDHGIPA